jgi:hypothetical protein
MCLALRTGELAFCQGNKAATKLIRTVTAADSVDKELLKLSGLIAELKQETQNVVRSLETPEQKREREIDELLAQAEQERKENK